MSQLGETTMNDHLVLSSGLLIIAAWLMPVCVRAEVGEYTDAEIKEKFELKVSDPSIEDPLSMINE